jgi:acetyl-CoA carboxylase biotin carboxylase subunit
MRVARTVDEVRKGFAQAQSEATKAFGDGAIYLERFIERPRHVEIQVLADAALTIHLGERECSVQRRHQKLIEETPSPAVDGELRAAMGAAAVRAAESVGYLGAGTVEFLLTPDGEFYFLEMNTRLQVEHPITEMVYGVDLVREQLRIAGGQPMSCPERPLAPRGHAIECRITAEDPFGGFLPVTGHIAYLQAPTGPGVRWDAGVESGSEVTRYYDSLVGKLVVWGDSRERAVRRMRRALDELVVVGIPTSQAFHRRVMDDATFASGAYDIEYCEHAGREVLETEPAADLVDAAVIAAVLAEDERRGAAVPLTPPAGTDGGSQWLAAARRGGLR